MLSPVTVLHTVYDSLRRLKQPETNKKTIIYTIPPLFCFERVQTKDWLQTRAH